MRSRPRRFGWPTVIGVLVTIPLLWWALRGIQFVEVWEHVRHAAKLPLVAAMLAIGLTLPARTARWCVLLRDERTGIPFRSLYHATAVGFAVNNLLPARAGEIARAYAARRLSGVRFSSAMTTIVLSRIFDGVTLFAVLVLATVAGWLPVSFVVVGISVGRIIVVAAVIFAVLLVLALAAVTFPDAVLRATGLMSRAILPRAWAPSVADGVKGAIDSLEVVRNPRQLATGLFWSAVVWSLGGLSYYLAFVAFDLAVPWQGAFTLQSIINFGLVVPATPGFVGVFEALTRAGLSLYGIDGTAAVSFAVAYHCCLYLPTTLPGLWSLGRTRISMRDVREEVDVRLSTAVQRLTGQYRVVERADG